MSRERDVHVGARAPLSWLARLAVVLLVLASAPAMAQTPAADTPEDSAAGERTPEDTSILDQDDDDEGMPPLTLRVGQFSITFDGFVRTGLNAVVRTDEATPEAIGENNGWVTFDARLGTIVNYADWVIARINFDGAGSTFEDQDDTVGTQTVRLLDAYGQVVGLPWIQLAVGQRRPPQSAEFQQSISQQLFARRSVVSDGLRVGEAVRRENTGGFGVSREVGVHLLSEVIALGPVGLRYHTALTNGNSSRDVFNDNNDFGVYARAEFHLLNALLGFEDDADESWLALGGFFGYNERTTGDRPQLLDITDTTYGGDLQVDVVGVQILAQFQMRQREFPDLDQTEQKTMGVVAQAGYWFPWPNLEFLLAYRFALLDPFFDADDENLLTSDDQLMYHTVGAGYRVTGMPVEVKVNYTLTQEEGSQEIGNDLLQLLFQLGW